MAGKRMYMVEVSGWNAAGEATFETVNVAAANEDEAIASAIEAASRYGTGEIGECRIVRQWRESEQYEHGRHLAATAQPLPEDAPTYVKQGYVTTLVGVFRTSGVPTTFTAAQLAVIADAIGVASVHERAVVRGYLVARYGCADCGAAPGCECKPEYGCRARDRRVTAADDMKPDYFAALEDASGFSAAEMLDETTTDPRSTFDRQMDSFADRQASATDPLQARVDAAYDRDTIATKWANDAARSFTIDPDGEDAESAATRAAYYLRDCDPESAAILALTIFGSSEPRRREPTSREARDSAAPGSRTREMWRAWNDHEHARRGLPGVAEYLIRDRDTVNRLYNLLDCPSEELGRGLLALDAVEALMPFSQGGDPLDSMACLSAIDTLYRATIDHVRTTIAYGAANVLREGA